MEKFRSGTVVRLKSGGQLMTTSEYYGPTKVECFWFDENNRPKKGVFPDIALEEATTLMNGQ